MTVIACTDFRKRSVHLKNEKYHLDLLSFLSYIGFHGMVYFKLQNDKLNVMLCTRLMCLRSTCTLTVRQNRPDKYFHLEGRSTFIIH